MIQQHGPSEKVIAVAASAGGIKAIQWLLAQLPADFPAPVVIVQHLDRSHPSMIASIMSRVTEMGVHEASQGEDMKAGNVYFAPPNRHLLVSPERTLVLVDTELVHFVRPSADLLFESLAASCKEGVIAVVLTGNGVDGAQGATAVKKMGGQVIVQEPDEAEFAGMPSAAMDTGSADHVLPLSQIPRKLKELVGEA